MQATIATRDAKGNRDGNNIFLGAQSKPTANVTALDAQLTLRGSAHRSAIQQAEIVPAVAAPLYAVNWVALPITTAATGISQTEGGDFLVEVPKGDQGQIIDDMQIEFSLPPLATVVKNTLANGDTLSVTSCYSSATFATGTLTGVFSVGNSLTVTNAGGGTGFAATVETVLNNKIATINVTNNGKGYTGGNWTFTDSNGAVLTGVPVLVADRFLYHAPNAGRMVLPRGSTTVGAAAFDHEYVSRNNFLNHFIVEGGGWLASKSLTGLTFAGGPEDNIQRVRAGGLSTWDVAAHYCRHLPHALVRSVSIEDEHGHYALKPCGGRLSWFTHFFLDDQPIDDALSFASDDPAELKRLSMQNVVVRMRIPFSGFYKGGSGLPFARMTSSKLFVRVSLNGWASVIRNSPEHNTNLAMTLAAQPVSAWLNSSAKEGDSLTNKTPALTVRTVTNGRLPATQHSMIYKSNPVDVPSAPQTVLTDAMFQATLLVRFKQFAETDKSALAANDVTQTIAYFEPVIEANKTMTPLNIDSDAMLLKFAIKQTLPTAMFVLFPQLVSNSLLNDPLNFRGPLDPLTAMGTGKESYGGRGPEVFTSVSVSLSDQNIINANATSALVTTPSALPRGKIYSEGVWILPMGDVGDPLAAQKPPFVSMTLQPKVQNMMFVPNPAAFQNHEFTGGLPAQNVKVDAWALKYNELLVDDFGFSIKHHN